MKPNSETNFRRLLQDHNTFSYIHIYKGKVIMFCHKHMIWNLCCWLNIVSLLSLAARNFFPIYCNIITFVLPQRLCATVAWATCCRLFWLPQTLETRLTRMYSRYGSLFDITLYNQQFNVLIVIKTNGCDFAWNSLFSRDFSLIANLVNSAL